MNSQDLMRSIAEYVTAQPLLSATLFGVIFAAVYLLLMVTTRLGDIRRGLQSFILSAMIHVLVMLFLGSVAPRVTRPVTSTEQVIEIPIREVIVEERTVESNSTEGQSPLLEKLPETAQQDFQRRDVPKQAGETVPAPERTPTTVESKTMPLPELERTSVPDAQPATERTEIQVGNVPAPNGVKIEEETAKAAASKSEANPQRTEPVARSRSERTNNRSATAESKPVPLAQDAGEPENREKMTPTRVREAEEGLAGKAVALKGSIVPEDPGPMGQPEEEKPAAAPFARTTPERTGVPTQPTVMDRKPGEEKEKLGSNLASQSKKSGQSPAMKLETPPGPEGESSSAVPAQVPSTYRLRDVNTRQERAVALGATPESEQAVERALVWLARHQDPEGFWDADGFGARCPAGDQCDGAGGDQRDTASEGGLRSNAFDPDALRNAGKFADTGVTGLVVLCYLGAGYTHEEGKYADQVDRALRWLVRQQQENGFIGGEALRYDRMYCHGMATLALGEACGMTRESANARHLRSALVKAVRYIVEVQNPGDGGWRYLPGQRGDMSMFGWQLMALRSAEVAGIPMPEETRAKMEQFLKKTATGKQGGLSAYMPGEAPKRSMTAESLFSRLILGVNSDVGATEEGVAYLMQELPKQSRPDLYYWYYGTLALYHHGGESWSTWNEALQGTLVTTQRKSGHATGSWDPRDPWSNYGGRLYATTFSVLSLEVYYRFLPLYQVGGKPEEGKKRK